MAALVRISRVGALTAILAALAMAPLSPAGAAPVGGGTLEQYTVGCDLLRAEIGAVTLYVDREFGDHASFAFWPPESSPEHDPPAMVSTSSTIRFDGRVVEGVLSLAGPDTEQPLGEATFQATLDPSGEPAVSRSRSSGMGASNDNVRILTRRQDAEVTGWLQLPGATAQLALHGCAGGLIERVVAYNNPHKFVEQVAPREGAYCVQQGPAGHHLRVEITDFDGMGAELAVVDANSGEDLAYGFAEISSDRNRLWGAGPVFFEGEQIGEATIFASIGKAVTRRERKTVGDVPYSVFVRDQPLDGSVHVSGFGEFLLTGCSFTFERGWLQWPNPEAQR